MVGLWNVETGKPLPLLNGHSRPVRWVAFTADGKRLITASGTEDGSGEIKLWDVAARMEITTLKGHDDDATCLALPRDTGLLLSGSSDGTIKLWEVPKNPPPARIAALARINTLIDSGKASDDDYLERARISSAAGKYADALADLAAATSRPDAGWRLWRELAVARGAVGQWEAAAEAYAGALASGGPVALRKDQFAVLRRLGRWREAAVEMGKWLEKNPNDIEPGTTQLALVLLLSGDRSRHQAIALRTLARKDRVKDPRTAAATARIAVLAPLGPRATVEAIRLARMAEDKQSNDWHRHVLGLAYYRAGKYEEAAAAFQVSLKNTNWNPVVNWLGMALVEKARGKEKEARQWLKKAADSLDRTLAEMSAGEAAPKGLRVNEWLEGLLLRREAEAVMGRP
jgi:tetratricopeptide (TPR) repeat protein